MVYRACQELLLAVCSEEIRVRRQKCQRKQPPDGKRTILKRKASGGSCKELFIQVILFPTPFISKVGSYHLGNNFHRLYFQSRLLSRNIL